MTNPFKFGTVVEGDYFTDREEDIKKSLATINSANHLVLISPRRYGKTSLVNKAVKQTGRPEISLNLQLVTSTTDLAAELLKRLFKVYPLEKIKLLVKNFRIIPTLSLNPATDTVDVSFVPIASPKPILEDVLNLIEQLGKRGKKPIVVLDEFQEIQRIDKGLDRMLRSIIQLHSHVNYVFMGSMESLMRDIFERKKSPFYHFGALQTLDVIPHKYFLSFLQKGFSILPAKRAQATANEILAFTKSHPYYTQQLAFHFWNSIKLRSNITLSEVISSVVQQHDIDFERLWMSLNLMDRQLVLELARSREEPGFIKNAYIPTSTRYSAYKKLLASGFLIQDTDGYRVEDPFFVKWLLAKREM